jgi:hypothetical protein
MKHGTALRDKLALAERLTARRSLEHADDFDIDALLPEMLFRTHCVARASAPLMSEALRQCESSGPGDAVAWGMRAYLTEQIEEEKEHADWLLEDLAVLHVARSEVLARIPPPTIAGLVGAQYYYIHHAHPVALLGYIAVLEATFAPLASVRALLARSRLPEAAFRTLLEYAELDPVHSGELFSRTSRAPRPRGVCCHSPGHSCPVRAARQSAVG